ncbi:MAG: HlyD family efflux transporter periplasmic adaptor subunit, partial [Rickettsiales bacterium]|nr:HlyD family efflux transporter periplasmic adaptor subunit [Rickettsiales bacterium]
MINHSKVRTDKFAVIVLCILLALWIFSGAVTGEARKPEYVDTDSSVAITVRLSKLEPQVHERVILLNGVTEASKIVDIVAETDGKVEMIHAQEGQFVHAGDMIMQLETRDRLARLKQAQAFVKQREIDNEAAQKLSTRGYAAEVRLAETAANLEAARANLIHAELELAHTKIVAPFSGILNSIRVEEGDYVGFGAGGSENKGDNNQDKNGGNSGGMQTSVATVISYDPYLVVGQVSERQVKYLYPGLTGEATLITGQTLKGQVTYVSSVADPKTRTFRVELSINNPDNAIKSGVTTEISIPVAREQAYLIPPSALSLNKEGDLGIKLLKVEGYEEKKVHGKVLFYPISQYDDTPDGLWVSGLPENSLLITMGHAFVETGDNAVGIIENS